MRPIKMTEEIKKGLLEDFEKDLETAKMFDGEYVFKRTYKWEDSQEKATIDFTPMAFAKMLSLIQHFESEVAWVSITKRIGEGSDFTVEDILVYPQTVTGTNVTTDQAKYTDWLYSPENDEVFHHIRMQGHSHVRMSTTPSGTDLADQQAIVSMLKPDSFYVFMIWNKSLNVTIKIFDMKNNTLFETGDVIWTVGGEGLEDFAKEAEKKVTRYTYPPQTNYQRNDYPAAQKPLPGSTSYGGVGVKSDTKKSKRRGTYIGSTYDFDDDDEDLYGGCPNFYPVK